MIYNGTYFSFCPSNKGGYALKKILILGASGLVGKALLEELSKDTDYEVFGTYLSNGSSMPMGRSFTLEIGDIPRFNNIIESIRPDIIVSCLRGDYEKQLQIHSYSASYLKEYGGRMYFCSTANVFDADTDKPHYENDLPKSESEYGIYKIQCEKEMKEILGDSLVILRLPLMWGKSCRRLSEMMDNIKHDREIEAYSNLYLTNNTDVMLAKQVHFIIQKGLTGIFNPASADAVPQGEFFRKLLDSLGLKHAKIKEERLPVEKYFLALLPGRADLPEELSITNDEIIEYLSSKDRLP
jgi:dTDP-4-dehydrorhamnose reductase